jgi:hypothetical protein
METIIVTKTAYFSFREQGFIIMLWQINIKSLSRLVYLTCNALVVILVNTMSNYTATIIKTGNSYALRVPKSYVENAKLELGQKVQISAPVALPKDYDPEAVKKAVRNLQAIGAFHSIKDPVAWQREIRKDRPLPGRS